MEDISDFDDGWDEDGEFLPDDDGDSWDLDISDWLNGLDGS